MTILIPTNNDNRYESIISSIEENNSWAFITLKNGQIESCEFFERKEDILEWIDYVIVLNNQEFVWPFIEENTNVLIVNKQKSIDEIIESFLFSTLEEYTK